MTLLVLDFGMSCPPVCDASDGLEVFFANDETVAELGGFAVDLVWCDVATFLPLAAAVVLARLAGRLETELALATDAVVGAVAAAGRRAGLVGDRGRALALGEVGDVSFLTPLLAGTESEAFVLLDCVAFDPAGGRDFRSGLGKVGDRREGFEAIFPGSSAVTDLGEEAFFWAFGDVGVFCGGLFGVVGDFVETRGRIRPPGGSTDTAFLLPMKFPLGGGSFRASFILVVNDVDCEVDVGPAIGFVFEETFGATAPALAVSEVEHSNGEPFSMNPKPPSNSADFRGVVSTSSLGTNPPLPLICSCADECSTPFADPWFGVVVDCVVPSNCCLLISAIVPTSLAFLSPHCWPCPASPGRSTATKLALTLLTGRL